MSKELVISSNRHETRLAILEDDQLVEIYFQQADEYSLAGSIHKGRVTRVLPGMQSAFVDLGLERDTFLYVSDFFEESEEYERLGGSRDDRKSDVSRRDARPVFQVPPVQKVAPPDEIPEVEPDEPAEPVLAAAPEPSEPARDQQRDSRDSKDARPGDQRDSRGRRSRRRRTRGRGFPDSKYASPSAANEPAESQTAEAEPEPEAEEAPREVFLLPGESLAKYSRGRQESGTREHTEQTRPENTVATDNEQAPEPDSNSVVTGNGDLQQEQIPVAAAFPEPSYVAPPRVTVTERVAPAGEEAPVADTASTEDLSSPAAPPATSQIAVDEPEAATEVSAVEQQDETAEHSATESINAQEEAESEVMTGGDAAEDALAAEIADADFGEPETDAEHEAEVTAVLELATESDPETPQPPITATVRDEGGRYLHRGSRGVRRRRRGGDRPDRERGEQAQQPRPEPEEARQVVRPDKPAHPSITDLLKEGQEIIVQIAKEPLGQKGARITSHIALPGRYVVYMPSLDHLGVSRKIESDEERQRLKRILQANHEGITGGFIVRTAGEGRTDAEIAADMHFLYNLWLDIRQKAEKKPAPLLLHHDLDIVQRTLRDQLTEDFKTIWVDNEEVYESILRFVQRFQPTLVSRVRLYTRETPMFDAFGITPELEKALRPKVWLKSGGYIVINQTEALVAIDINTGKYVGRSNRLEDTIVKTNTEAIKEIVRQVRLRDLGGIIVVDFIDMDERKNRQKVMQALEEAMRADRAPYKILQFNDFGLVAITRKRVKQSLERALCTPCPVCEGAGYVKSVKTVIGEILTEAHKLRKVVEGEEVILRVNPEVAKTLKSASNKYLEELEEVLGRPVLVTGDHALHPEKFDLA
jgi:Rne/Rng family ribonuclease